MSDVKGRCPSVLVTGWEPTDAATAIAGGWDPAGDGLQPDVWIPDSSSWTRVLQAQSSTAGLLPADRPSIATSPVTVAMPERMAAALSLKNNRVDWNTLLAMADDPKGWGAFGHPEWEAVRWGLSDPDRTAVGLSAVAGVLSSAAGRPANKLTADAVAGPPVRRSAQAFARTVIRPADTVDSLVNGLRVQDNLGQPFSYASGLVLTEQAVWAYNAGRLQSQSHRPSMPLRALYPTAGETVLDYPYLVLKAPWNDDVTRSAAVGFLDYLRGSRARRAFDGAGFRNSDGRAGAALSSSRQVDAHSPAAITGPLDPTVATLAGQTWAKVRRQSRSLVVLDVSGSMGQLVPGTRKSKLDLAREAISSGLGLYADDDQLGFWSFSTGLSGAVDWRDLVSVGPLSDTINGVVRRDAVTSVLQSLTPQSGTALYDTTLAAYLRLTASYAPDRVNTMVLLTDGRNEDTVGISRDALLAKLRASYDPARPVRIITIGYGPDADVQTLQAISDSTHGAAYVSTDPKSIEQAFLAAVTTF